MKEDMRQRGYKNHVINKAINKVKQITRTETLQYKHKKRNERVPFVVTHHPSNPPLRTWLHEKQTTLQRSEKMKKAMPQIPVVGERNGKSMQAILMPTVVPPMDANNQPGVKKCTRKCITCREHLVETKEFTSSTTGETFPIRQNLSCDTNNIIYMLFCNKCQHSQYIGETRNSLKKRFALHRTDIKKDAGTAVTKHFNLPNHTLQNLRAFPIQKVLTDDHNQRREIETKWINAMKTRKPNGLNTKI